MISSQMCSSTMPIMNSQTFRKLQCPGVADFHRGRASSVSNRPSSGAAASEWVMPRCRSRNSRGVWQRATSISGEAEAMAASGTAHRVAGRFGRDSMATAPLAACVMGSIDGRYCLKGLRCLGTAL